MQASTRTAPTARDRLDAWMLALPKIERPVEALVHMRLEFRVLVSAGGKPSAPHSPLALMAVYKYSERKR